MPAVAKRKLLRHRLAFQEKPTVSDGYGNTEAPAFVTIFTISAAIEPRLGGEQVIASRLAGVKPVTVGVRQSRATKLVTTDWRALGVCSCHAGRVFNIRSIADADDDRQFFDMLCEEGAAT